MGSNLFGLLFCWFSQCFYHHTSPFWVFPCLRCGVKHPIPELLFMHGDMDCFYIQGVSGLLAQPSGGGVLRQAGELLFLVFEVSHATIIVAAIDLFVVRNRSARCEEKEKLESVNQGKFGYSKKEDLELPLFFICLLIRQKPNTIRYREQQAIKVYKYFEFRKIWVQQEGN